MNRKEQVYISTNQLSYHNATNLLFSDVSLSLNSTEKVGLVGFNGAGKSTLLQLLTKDLEPGSGQVIHAKSLRYYMVEQRFPEYLLSLTPEDAILDVLDADERISEGWRASVILENIGVGFEYHAIPCSKLSGGQQTRLLLGRAQLCAPNVLLLDEPSNHLDLPTILWLEAFLSEWRGSFILVSHDTRILDTVTDSTWIIASGGVHQYRLPCTQALLEHEQKESACQQQYQDQENEIERIESSARQLAIWGKEQKSKSSARKAQSMFKRVDKLKLEQNTLPEPYPWNLFFPGQHLPAKRILTCNDLAIRVPNKKNILYMIDELLIRPGEKIALIGANGMGKSTFLQLIWKSYLDKTDTVKLHESTIVAYYDQLQNGVDSESEITNALFDFCSKSRVSPNNEQLKQALLKAGFQWERLQSKVKSLSGGERARLLFAGISLINSHLLLLDEPTNHLDISGKHALEKQLIEFNGTVLLVSHDRNLIESVCSRFLVIGEEKLQSFNDAQKAYFASQEQDEAHLMSKM
ncbi:ABC-F family ATP-binding cassette domain-containing protein [Dickeya lacustris]|uniref:ABC-F family ATP-binding cassette domain-containing protein n=1 Tax=Dickeya lacustris TaxID=2259638 RepID=A0ABY8G5E6_9GAMM|nr:ABC-F family ATP-binding cassette domain-containing protein [Dickeya lacustris]WFN55154.1 ABC-F family ATP-binding cassette domain-containing protein [Dickeya lacustris]